VNNLFEALMGFLLDIEDEKLWHEVRHGSGGGLVTERPHEEESRC
jgi:hypothetical protein